MAGKPLSFPIIDKKYSRRDLICLIFCYNFLLFFGKKQLLDEPTNPQNYMGVLALFILRADHLTNPNTLV